MAMYKVRGRKMRNVSIESVLVPVTVGGANIAASEVQKKIDEDRVAAGKTPMGPFLNVESGVRYLQTGVYLGATMLHGKTADITLPGFIASIPQTMEALYKDTMKVMNKGAAATGVKVTSAPRVTVSGGGSGAAPMSSSSALQQELTMSGGLISR